METKVRYKGKEISVKENMFDAAIRFIDPIRANKRFAARFRAAFAAGYTGASRSRNATKDWSTSGGDADSDTLLDLPTLRDRSSDLIRNNPFALGAINTPVTNIVGTGLRLKPQIDHKFLGMEDDEADLWEENTEREWRFFAESIECDAERKLNFYQKTELALRSSLEKGDYFELMTEIVRAGSPYKLKLQGIEAERVTNPQNTGDTAEISAGIEVDEHGATSQIHVQTVHPGSDINFNQGEWQAVKAFGEKTGRKNIIHLYKMLRPGQRRGVPFLAPVIEALKQISRYTDAELMAAVIQGMFTVFIETDAGTPMKPGEGLVDTGVAPESDGTMSLGNGSIVGLNPGEKMNTANPGRPNAAFDPFVDSILKYIGAALEIPHEVITGHFSVNFSAARAALNEAWKFFKAKRKWLADCYCQPIYENFMWEAVLSGRITAPGFMSDPMIRKAYLQADWIGPARGQIKEGEEVKAAKGRLESFITTIDQETIEMTGKGFKQNIRQIKKERKILKESGLVLNQENEVKENPSEVDVNINEDD